MAKKMKIVGNNNTQVTGSLYASYVIHLNTAEAAAAFANQLKKFSLGTEVLKKISKKMTRLIIF